MRSACLWGRSLRVSLILSSVKARWGMDGGLGGKGNPSPQTDSE